MESKGSPNLDTDGRWSKYRNSNEKPMYVNGENIAMSCGTNWCIIRDGTVVAVSLNATHPLTVPIGGWYFFVNNIRVKSNTFRFNICNFNDPSNPYSMEDLGDDFFIYVRLTKIIYWVNPLDNSVEHSGAKKSGDRLGRRWCPYCRSSFSANNFHSQHIKNIHKELYRELRNHVTTNNTSVCDAPIISSNMDNIELFTCSEVEDTLLLL